MSDTLTLPKVAGRSRVRLKRPRRPSREEVWWLFWTAWATIFAVVAFVQDQPLPGVADTVMAGFYWRAFHRMRRGVWPRIEPCWCALIVSVAVFALAGTFA